MQSVLLQASHPLMWQAIFCLLSPISAVTDFVGVNMFPSVIESPILFGASSIRSIIS